MPRNNRSQTPRGRSVEALASKVFAQQQQYGGHESSADERIRRVQPVHSISVGEKAIQLVQGNREIRTHIKKEAIKTIRRWSTPKAAHSALEFWANPAHELATFVRDTYVGGLSTLGFANVVEIYEEAGEDVAAQLFHPDMRHTAELSVSALREAAGREEVLTGLDAPIPDGITVHTYTDRWRDETTTKPLPARFAVYDQVTMAHYLTANRQYSSYVVAPNFTARPH